MTVKSFPPVPPVVIEGHSVVCGWGGGSVSRVKLL